MCYYSCKGIVVHLFFLTPYRTFLGGVLVDAASWFAIAIAVAVAIGLFDDKKKKRKKKEKDDKQ